MIRINLLPFRAARKERNVRKQLHLYGFTVFFVFLAMTYFFMNLNSRLVDLRARQKAGAAELDKYADTNEELKRIRAETGDLRGKLSVIKMLEKSRTKPGFLLKEIARAVPNDRLWLRAITEKNGVLRLEGSAVDNDSVALLMTELEKRDPMVGVDLVHAERRRISRYKLNVTDFSLVCMTNSFGDANQRKAVENAEPGRARR
jgi:type IV pilus assembly protein PilN